jgi:hypothetical protein
MTTTAHGEVVAAKRALPVVTTHATESACGCVVIERLRRCYVIRAYAMTSVAAQAFVAIVLRVTEAELECARRLARARGTSGLVADAARGDVSAARFRLWTVTLKTRRVRVEAGGDRQRHAGACRPMTVCAGNAGVTRVIEFHAEAGQRGELL